MCQFMNANLSHATTPYIPFSMTWHPGDKEEPSASTCNVSYCMHLKPEEKASNFLSLTSDKT